MPRPPRLDAVLLLLLGASLLLGGGLGCEPALEGTTLRVSSFEGLYYAGITGRREPGNGWAVLEYPVKANPGPTNAVAASIEATVGVLNPRFLEASAGGEGCVALREKTPGADFRICASYEIAPPNLRIFSTLSGEEADCPGATRALLRVADDGADVSVLYTCPGAEDPVELESVPTQLDGGERWFLAFGAEGLAKGAEIGFADLRYTSAGPFDDAADMDRTDDVVFDAFNALRLGIEAYHDFAASEFSDGMGASRNSWIALNRAANVTLNQSLFADTDVARRLVKARSSFLKLDNKLPPVRESYFKAFAKVAAEEAAAIAEAEDVLVWTAPPPPPPAP